MRSFTRLGFFDAGQAADKGRGLLYLIEQTLAGRVAEQCPQLPLVMLSSISAPIHAPEGLFAASLSKSVEESHSAVCFKRRSRSSATAPRWSRPEDRRVEKSVRAVREALDRLLGAGGRSMAPCVVANYDETSTELIQRMQQSVKDNDPASLADAAHALKGSSSTMGMAGVAKLCRGWKSRLARMVRARGRRGL